MNSNRLILGALAVACLSLVTFSGCGQPTTADGNAMKKPLPKMDFHKPASFSAAVSRIREIHETLISEDGLPPSISYTVKEVSHSHGDGDTPHVHYHLVDDHDDHDHDHEGHDHDHGDHEGHDHGEHDDHDHDHADPFEPTHRVTVDIFTELKDVAKWLPSIASDGDLPRDSWNTSKEVSETMTSRLEKVMESGLPLVQRTAYQSESAEIENWIKKLESLVEPAAATTEN